MLATHLSVTKNGKKLKSVWRMFESSLVIMKNMLRNNNNKKT